MLRGEECLEQYEGLLLGEAVLIDDFLAEAPCLLFKIVRGTIREFKGGWRQLRGGGRAKVRG